MSPSHAMIYVSLLRGALITSWFSRKKTTECFYFCGQIIETLRSRSLGKSRDQDIAVRFEV